MTAATLGAPRLEVDGRAVQALTIPAAELAEDDIIGGETWREVRSVVVYAGPDDEPVCQYITAAIGSDLTGPPAYVAADVQIAVLRPVADEAPGAPAEAGRWR